MWIERQTKLFAALLIASLLVNSLVWNGHLDARTSSPDLPNMELAHVHHHNGQRIDACDHCCHMASHFLATPAILPRMLFIGLKGLNDFERTYRIAFHTDPPFIPPIA